MTGAILNIDTSLDTAIVCLAKNGHVVAQKTNAVLKEHAVFLHKAIQELMIEQSADLNQLDAIAVTEGPGSYTGLRVGMSAAKGLCYALNKPLISIGTLPMIAYAEVLVHQESGKYYCPMIDARRMEVFTAVYDHQLNEIWPPQSVILDADSFSSLLNQYSIHFSGNGSTKWKSIISNPRALFDAVREYAHSLSYLSYKKFKQAKFSDLVGLKPLYIKDPQI